MRRAPRALSTALIGGLLCSLSLAATANPSVTALREASQQARQALVEAIGAAPCSQDAQCQVLPIGDRPCGGPEGHLAWSKAHSKSARIQALASAYRQARQAENQQLQLMSDCRVLPEPVARCVAQHCQLQFQPHPQPVDR